MQPFPLCFSLPRCCSTQCTTVEQTRPPPLVPSAAAVSFPTRVRPWPLIHLLFRPSLPPWCPVLWSGARPSAEGEDGEEEEEKKSVVAGEEGNVTSMLPCPCELVCCCLCAACVLLLRVLLVCCLCAACLLLVLCSLPVLLLCSCILRCPVLPSIAYLCFLL